MKKLFTLLMIAGLVLLSCEKEYTYCFECKKTPLGLNKKGTEVYYIDCETDETDDFTFIQLDGSGEPTGVEITCIKIDDI